MRVPAVPPCVHHTESMEKLLEDTVSLCNLFFFFPLRNSAQGEVPQNQPSKLQFRTCLAGAPQPEFGQCPRIRVQASLHCPALNWQHILECLLASALLLLRNRLSTPTVLLFQLFQVLRRVVWITSCSFLPSIHPPCFWWPPVSSAAL